MELPIGTVIVTNEDQTGRVQKILTENLRVVQVYCTRSKRFRITEKRVAEMRRANQAEIAQLKLNAVEHNRRLAEKIEARQTW